MSGKHCVLVVDDESFVRESLVDLLENEGYGTLSASGAAEALRLLGTEKISLIVTDLRMPDGDGLSLLEDTRKQHADLPVVVLTGMGTVSEAVQAMKAGAFDFIQKPVDPEQFVILVRRALEHRDLVSEVKYLRGAVEDLRGAKEEMVGASAALSAVRALIGQVAPTNATVLITGESGTGKELVADEIHQRSPRSGQKLVRVNCAAIPEALFESEFFGHRRGAFTSAVADRVGRFTEAEGGTIVLDEIGTLKPDMQAKLLRVLESGEYQVVGESRTRVADVRVVASTNEDLAARVREGTFRRDLYYRLHIFPIDVPPLRRRKEDLPALAEHFLSRVRLVSRGQSPTSGLLSKAAQDVLRAYDWPGNLRELRNVLERAAILAGGNPVDAALLERVLGSSSPGPEAPVSSGGNEDLHIRRRIEALERHLLEKALALASGRRRDAASLLGIDPKNMGYYLRKHGLAGDSAEESEA